MKARAWRILIPAILLLFLCSCSAGPTASPAIPDTPSPTPAAAQEHIADIGVGVWGDSPETVEALCEYGEWAFVRTSGEFAGYDSILEYYFNDKGLYSGQHWIMGTQSRDEKYLSIKETLTEQYGEPSAEKFLTGDQSEGLLSFEDVLAQNGRAEAFWRIYDSSNSSRSSLLLSMLPDGHVTVLISSLT